jgi:hypothetical protein
MWFKKSAEGSTPGKRTGTTRLRNNYASVAPAGPDRSSRDREVISEDTGAEWAVIVNHGMGQQVHFETLESIALAIRSAEIRARKDADEIRVRVVKLDTIDKREIELVRAEMSVTGYDGITHGVHVYESYWAPLTEGRVSMRDVLQFLGEGAANGFVYLVRHFGRFDRWAFGKMRSFPIRGWLTVLKLVFALLLLFAPILLANSLAVTQSVHVLFVALRQSVAGHTGNPFWLDFLLNFLTPYVICFEVCLVAFALGTVVLPKVYRSPFLEVENPLLVAVRWILRVLALVLSLGALAVVLYGEVRLFLAIPGAWRAYRGHEVLSRSPLWILIVVWGVALAAAFVFRWFLIEFIGDVAVYVSAHKLSKFEELRDAIQRSVLDVMGAVYTAKTLEGQAFRYNKIIVVGHSLGSVISYDLLNQLLLEDELSTVRADVRDVRERTKLLVTFGSPLDKIAYLFRIKKSTDELRDAAIAAWQPMIRNYRFRPDAWWNVYSWMDLFSAPLHFYDDPDDKHNGGDQRVENLRDRRAWVPIVAHTAYWTDPLLGDLLYQSITTPERVVAAAPASAP